MLKKRQPNRWRFFILNLNKKLVESQKNDFFSLRKCKNIIFVVGYFCKF